MPEAQVRALFCLSHGGSNSSTRYLSSASALTAVYTGVYPSPFPRHLKALNSAAYLVTFLTAAWVSKVTSPNWTNNLTACDGVWNTSLWPQGAWKLNDMWAENRGNCLPLVWSCLIAGKCYLCPVSCCDGWIQWLHAERFFFFSWEFHVDLCRSLNEIFFFFFYPRKKRLGTAHH